MRVADLEKTIEGSDWIVKLADLHKGKGEELAVRDFKELTLTLLPAFKRYVEVHPDLPNTTMIVWNLDAIMARASEWSA